MKTSIMPSWLRKTKAAQSVIAIKVKKHLLGFVSNVKPRLRQLTGSHVGRPTIEALLLIVLLLLLLWLVMMVVRLLLFVGREVVVAALPAESPVRRLRIPVETTFSWSVLWLLLELLLLLLLLLLMVARTRHWVRSTLRST